MEPLLWDEISRTAAYLLPEGQSVQPDNYRKYQYMDNIIKKNNSFFTSVFGIIDSHKLKKG